MKFILTMIGITLSMLAFATTKTTPPDAPKLQRIDGVQTQSLAEQRHLGFDVGRREILEIKRRHHDLFQLAFNVIPVHVTTNYTTKPRT